MIALLLALALTVVSALFAVVSPNIMNGVIFLLCTNVSLGIAYYMMGAPTVALFQFAIFAGAIVVFFVVTVMFTQAGRMEVTDDQEEAEQ